jgi:hypothetical protein
MYKVPHNQHHEVFQVSLRFYVLEDKNHPLTQEDFWRVEVKVKVKVKVKITL